MATCAVAASATQSAAKTTARSERIRSVITMTLIVAPASTTLYRTLRYWPVPSLAGRVRPPRGRPLRASRSGTRAARGGWGRR
ncbi:hypothetical protein GCM10009639_44800 [Kitasatospora putterlickiae]|uniref:Secreted protein n=1 Tax=Kitasatospora putterlickiae TaxID=221725 RepID=A0ABN1YA04_9ACTN